MSDQPKFITPPNTLKGKVTYGPGGVDLDALERAEAVIANLQGNYLTWVQDDLVKLQQFYDLAKSDEANRPKHVEEIFRVAHDVKGQGGSFDYHLMTAVGNQLCRFIENTSPIGAAELNAIKVHIDAMKLIIAQRMEGDGGKVGENLVSGLQAIVAKLANAPPK